jgi:phosphoglycerate dehydrogenase-like enzyme
LAQREIGTEEREAMNTKPKWKVLMAVHHLGDRAIPFIRRMEEAGLEVIRNPHGRWYTEDELIAALPGVFATFASVEPYTDRVFREAKDLQIVARYGVGYDKIDVAAATRHGVMIAMAFGTNQEAVADSAFTLMAAIVQKTVTHHLRVKGGGWGLDIHPGLWRMTVGIVGLGRIGKAMARRCPGFEMRVLAYDIRPDIAFARDNNVEFVPLETLLRESDVVTLHIPHTPETDNFMNRERFGLMKPTAYFINTARGGVVDEEALYEALTSGKIAGAGLDVFKQEPPKGSPLLNLDNVVFSPHSAGSNLTSEAAVTNRCVDSILAVARGESPGEEYLLNPEVLQPGRGRMTGRQS